MSTAITLRATDNTLSEMETVANQCGLSAVGELGNFKRALTVAAGIKRLRQLMTKEFMADIMALQGTSLGFRTDKDRDGGYPEEVVRDCAIEVIMRGGSLVGNQMNIIAGRCYLTKEFFQAAQRDYPGLTNLAIDIAVTGQTQSGAALCTCFATWRLNGVADSMSCDIIRDDQGKAIADMRLPVKINNGQGPDAIIGKAERKFRARIHSRITGTTFSEDDADETRPNVKVIRSSGRTEQLAAMLAEPEPELTSDADDYEATKRDAYDRLGRVQNPEDLLALSKEVKPLLVKSDVFPWEAAVETRRGEILKK